MANNERGSDADEMVTTIVAVGVLMVVFFPNATAAILGGGFSSLGAFLLKSAFTNKK